MRIDKGNYKHASRKWSKEDCELLTELWNDGVDVGWIATAFEVSRNAVLGIRHRLGLPIRRRPMKGSNYLPRRGYYR